MGGKSRQSAEDVFYNSIIEKLNKYHQDKVEELEVKTSKHGQEYGVARDGNGHAIMVNGVPYVDRFDSGAPKTNTGTVATPTAETPVFSLEDYVKGEKEKIENDTGATDISKYYAGIYDDIAESASGAIAALDEKLKALKAMLGSERSVGQQRAAINHAKLLKYLPEQLKSIGLYGVGTSQGAFLKAANAYNNQLSEVERAYMNQLLEAESNHMSASSAISSSAASAKASAKAQEAAALVDYKARQDDRVQELNDLLANYNINKTLEDEKNLKESQDFWYNYYMGNANDLSGLFGTFETEDAVDNFLEDAPNRVSEDQFKVIDEIAAELKAGIKQYAEEQASAEKLTAAKEATIKKNKGDGDNVNDVVRLTIGDKTVKVLLGEANAEIAKEPAVKQLDRNTIFQYNGVVYYKTPDGKVVAVNPDEKRYGKLYKYLTSGE